MKSLKIDSFCNILSERCNQRKENTTEIFIKFIKFISVPCCEVAHVGQLKLEIKSKKEK
jgi:hypothetical protein